MHVICVRETAGHVSVYVREYDRGLPAVTYRPREVQLRCDLLNKIYSKVSLQISSCGKSITFQIQYLLYLRVCRTTFRLLSATFKPHAF
jgi:hypothetical protein